MQRWWRLDNMRKQKSRPWSRCELWSGCHRMACRIVWKVPLMLVLHFAFTCLYTEWASERFESCLEALRKPERPHAPGKSLCLDHGLGLAFNESLQRLSQELSLTIIKTLMYVMGGNIFYTREDGECKELTALQSMALLCFKSVFVGPSSGFSEGQCLKHF